MVLSGMADARAFRAWVAQTEERAARALAKRIVVQFPDGTDKEVRDSIYSGLRLAGYARALAAGIAADPTIRR